MTNTKSVASKAFVAIVAAAMVFSLVAPAAKAATAEELQAQITALMAQIEALKGGSMTPAPVGGNCAAIPAPLTMNATGANVTALQNFLINSGQSIPAGATGFFGGQTKAALAAWQSANGVAPAVGYYGPVTAAAMAAKCVPTVPTTPTTPTTPGTSTDLQGEGTLDSFEIDDADDTDVQEGAEEVAIAELTLEATDGDIEIDRMTFELKGVSAPTEADAWDVFEEISLWVDGDMVAEFDASDEDNYLDEDLGTFRFSGLELVAMEDEELDIVVAATISSNVDDAGIDASWKIGVNSVRYFDADGVAEDDETTGDLDAEPSAVTAGFEIVEQGDGEELRFSLGDNNPDATDVVVDTDSKTNDVTVLEYTIEAKDADIELNTLFVELQTSEANLALVVDDVSIEIDGDVFDAENSPSGTVATTSFEFDIDGDITIDADDEVTVKVMVDLRAQEVSNGVDRYVNGTTIKAVVASEEVNATDAEGADDISEFSGSATGESHTLVAEGILVPADAVTATADTTGDNDQTGEFTIEFDVTAVEGDFYISENAGESATTGVQFLVETAAGTSTASGVLTSTGDEDTPGVFTVSDGETETFTLTVTVDTAATTQTRVTLTEINYTANPAGNIATEVYVPTPASDFRTAYKNINAN